MKTHLNISFCIVIMLYSICSICSADVPPVEVLRDIFNEKAESVYSLDVRADIAVQIIYPLNPKQIEADAGFRNRQIDVITEAGKIFTSKTDNVSEGMQSTAKNAWNGNTMLRSSVTTNGKGQNSLSSKFDISQPKSATYQLEELGVAVQHTLGTLDLDRGDVLAFGYTPFLMFNRIRKSAAMESIRLEEIDHQGTKCILMSLVIDKGPLASILKFPLIEHIINPELDYACVETRWYDKTGMMQKMEKNFRQTEDGKYVLQSGKITKYVRQFHTQEHLYPETDFDKVACILEVNFPRYKVNQPISPAVYEQENVFVPGLETWDADQKVKIEQSLSEIERDTLLALNRHLGRDMPIAKKVEKPNEIETKRQEPSPNETTQIVDSFPVEQVGVSKGRGSMWWTGLILSVVLVVIVATIIIHRMFSRKHNVKRTNTFISLIAFIIFIGLTCVARASPDKARSGYIKTEIDLGVKLISEEIITYEYKLKNDTDQPMYIRKIKTSCKCTVIAHPNSINAGETSPIVAKISLAGTVGPFVTNIAIFTGQDENPSHVIVLRAYKQGITIMKNIVFPDSDIDGKLSLSPLHLHKTFTVTVFDTDTTDISLDHLDYNKDYFAITPLPYRKKNFTIQHNNKTWHYVEKYIDVQIKPQNIGPKSFNERVYVKKLPIQAMKLPNGRNAIGPLFTMVTGRVFDTLYTSPSSINYLIRKSAKSNPQKHFTVFNKKAVEYDVIYNNTLFSLEATGNGNYKLIAMKDQIFSMMDTKQQIEETIQFSYLSDENIKKTFDLPIKITTY